MPSSLSRATVSIRRYEASISGLKYFTGRGRSPVSTSPASWYMPRTATRSGLTAPPKSRLRVIASACAIMATRRLCSWMFSACVLCIRPHRRMKRIRDRYAKK